MAITVEIQKDVKDGHVFGLAVKRANRCGKHQTVKFVDLEKSDAIDVREILAYLSKWSHCDICHP